jgi:hypothetical protein
MDAADRAQQQLHMQHTQRSDSDSMHSQHLIHHLPAHLRPDHNSVHNTQQSKIGGMDGGASQQSEYGAAGLHFHDTDGPDFTEHAHPHSRHHPSSSSSSSSQLTESTALGVDEDLLVGDDFDVDHEEHAEHADDSTYDIKSLPPHACKYCGIHSPASVVKCNICNKW